LTLTKEVVLAQVPGRTLDIMVAEEVMGFRYKYVERYNVFMWVKSETECTSWFPASTDIAVAWEVVEKMREMGVYLNIHADKDTYYVLGLVSSESAPEAICKAALIAIIYMKNDANNRQPV